MFDKESQPTLCRVGGRLYSAHTQAPIVEELGLESTLESADYTCESVYSNADLPKIGVGVRAFKLMFHQLYFLLLGRKRHDYTSKSEDNARVSRG